ncbi:hypothetical protein ACHAWC_002397 [Mediolabrus comicus]
MGRNLSSSTTNRGGVFSLNLPTVIGVFGFLYTLSFSLSMLAWKKQQQQAVVVEPSQQPQQQLLRGERSSVVGSLTETIDNEYTLWSKDDTYFETCRKHYIGNYTWGKARTKLVDKAEAKNIVRAMNIDGLHIPEVYAIYNIETMKSDFTLEAMRKLPQPYIIKPTHMAGSVSRMRNDTWSCIKGSCDDTPMSEEALDEIQWQAEADLRLDFSRWHKEMQYKDVPRQIIIEEDVSKESKLSLLMWFSSNGKLLFGVIPCKTGGFKFFNTNFQLLNLRITSKAMCSELSRPPNFDKQVEVATALAEGLPVGTGIVRLDFFTTSENMFFSEFTFTTQYCSTSFGFHPRVADGLLHAVQYGAVDPSRVTPEFVERIIHDKSWVLLTLSNGRTVDPVSSGAFPSPVDLCEHVSSHHIAYEDRNWQSDENVRHCLEKAKEVATVHQRCIAIVDDRSSLSASTGDRRASFLTVMTHIDWGKVIPLLLIVVLMTNMNIGTRIQHNQYVNNILYLVVVLIFIGLTLPGVKSIFSAHSILDIAKHFEAFSDVHPVESSHIALSHFATCWFVVASWRSKSLRNLLFWQLLNETVTAGVDKYTYLSSSFICRGCALVEDEDVVHCTHAIFNDSINSYAFDILIREYVLTPIFVYGYLLPRFILYWVSMIPFFLWFGLWIGALIAVNKVKVTKELKRRRNFR